MLHRIGALHLITNKKMMTADSPSPIKRLRLLCLLQYGRTM